MSLKADSNKTAKVMHSAREIEKILPNINAQKREDIIRALIDIEYKGENDATRAAVLRDVVNNENARNLGNLTSMIRTEKGILSASSIIAATLWSLPLATAATIADVTLFGGFFSIMSVATSIGLLVDTREKSRLMAARADAVQAPRQPIPPLPAAESVQPPQMPPLLKLAGPTTAFNNQKQEPPASTAPDRPGAEFNVSR